MVYGLDKGATLRRRENRSCVGCVAAGVRRGGVWSGRRNASGLCHAATAAATAAARYHRGTGRSGNVHCDGISDVKINCTVIFINQATGIYTISCMTMYMYHNNNNNISGTDTDFVILKGAQGRLRVV